jgi:hypothetical protein
MLLSSTTKTTFAGPPSFASIASSMDLTVDCDSDEDPLQPDMGQCGSRMFGRHHDDGDIGSQDFFRNNESRGFYGSENGGGTYSAQSIIDKGTATFTANPSTSFGQSGVSFGANLNAEEASGFDLRRDTAEGVSTKAHPSTSFDRDKYTFGAQPETMEGASIRLAGATTNNRADSFDVRQLQRGSSSTVSFGRRGRSQIDGQPPAPSSVAGFMASWSAGPDAALKDDELPELDAAASTSLSQGSSKLPTKGTPKPQVPRWDSSMTPPGSHYIA